MRIRLLIMKQKKRNETLALKDSISNKRVKVVYYDNKKRSIKRQKNNSLLQVLDATVDNNKPDFAFPLFKITLPY